MPVDRSPGEPVATRRASVRGRLVTYGLIAGLLLAAQVEVEQWPADVLAGRDPQLEKAIEVVLQELEKDPPPAPERPPFPVRVRR